MNKIKEKMGFYKLSEKKMEDLRGLGEPGHCGCACHYVNCGGSSSNNNASANDLEGKWSTGPGCAQQ
jgi:hypothetical protein